MMGSIKSLMKKISGVFIKNFGTTPLRQRNEDIYKEALELSRFTSTSNLKEEHGDLLCSLLMSFHENGWDPVECAEATLKKIQLRKIQYQAYGRKISTILYGGAFDPITPGHVAVAKFLLDFSSMFDEVWITPCYRHLYNKNMASPKHRLAMCRLATQHDRRIKVFDYEIVNKLGGETYNFVKRLLDENFARNERDFSMVIGMDNANTFSDWMNFKDLERMIRFVVVPRTGVKIKHKSNWYLKPPHMFLVPEKSLPKTSSTEIRDELKLSRFNPYSKIHRDDFIDQEVLKYIIDNKLYRYQD